MTFQRSDRARGPARRGPRRRLLHELEDAEPASDHEGLCRGLFFAEAVVACEKAQSSTPFKWNGGKQTAVIGVNSVRLEQGHRHRELHARCRQRLLRLRSDQEKSRYRFEFPRTGVGPNPVSGTETSDDHPTTIPERMAGPIPNSAGSRSARLPRRLPTLPPTRRNAGETGRSARWATATSISSSSSRGPGSIAVKQALPYVRLVGESWPLPLSRSHYEHLALTHRPGWRPGWCPRFSIMMRRSP